MKAIMFDGTEKEIDTSFMFNNQYNTVNGERIYDVNIKKIVDDIRLGEFYCCSKKQGTYDEVQKAINKERELINDCENCFWNQIDKRIEEECSKKRVESKDKIVIHNVTAYTKCCKYKNEYGEKCVRDIDEKPQLFREVNDCFFCKYPDGVPDMETFKQFMIDNADKYGIVPYWGDGELNLQNTLKYKNKFGSYVFEVPYFGKGYFKLSNARNRFLFYIDFTNKKFILDEGIGYKVANRLSTSVWNNTMQKSVSQPITNYDKFAKWFWGMVDDYNKEVN